MCDFVQCQLYSMTADASGEQEVEPEGKALTNSSISQKLKEWVDKKTGLLLQG